MSHLVSEHIDIVLLGDSSVGKTCLSTRFDKNHFSSFTTSTIGAAYVTRRVNINIQDKSKRKSQQNTCVPCTLKLSDTAGTETYSSLSSFYCRKAHCALLCFDLTFKASLYNLAKWMQLADTSTIRHFVVVGCKNDILEAFEACETDWDREQLMIAPHIQAAKVRTEEFVTRDMIEEQLQVLREAQKERNGTIIGYFPTSAKTGAGVMDVFERAAQEIVQERQMNKMSGSSPSNRGVNVHLFSEEVAKESTRRRWCWW